MMTRTDMLDRDLWALQADLSRILEVYTIEEARMGIGRIRWIAAQARHIAEAIESVPE